MKHSPSLLRCTRPGQPTLLLCPPHPRDAPEVAAAIHASLKELRAFMPWAHFDQTPDIQYTRLIDTQANYWKGTEMVFHVREEGPDGAPGPLLGCIGLHPRTLNGKGWEIGYWIRTDAAGRGLTTLGTQCLLVLAFDYMGSERVQCGYKRTNAASGRVNAKVGFHIEAELPYYGTQGTPEMLQNGYDDDVTIVLTRLLPADRPTLPWYADVRDRLDVFDWHGDLMTTP